jgi:hypothetical protein
VADGNVFIECRGKNVLFVVQSLACTRQYKLSIDRSLDFVIRLRFFLPCPQWHSCWTLSGRDLFRIIEVEKGRETGVRISNVGGPRHRTK